MKNIELIEKMEKVFDFGKIAYDGNRKINKVTIKIELKGDEKPVLSICGNIWNSRGTDIVCGGQCLDDLLPYFRNNTKFTEIYRLWKLYHLNDMHAGTEVQEELLKKYNTYEYGKACKLLKKHNLYEDKGYRYGSAWLYRPIPENDLKKIIEIIEE